MSAAQAVPFGLTHGRSAFPDNNPSRSIEVGGLFSDNQVRGGLRVNQRLSNIATAYLDLGYGQLESDVGDDNDGASAGIGLYWFIPNQPLADRFDLAAHVSVHGAELEGSDPITGSAVDYDYGNWVLDFLFSGISNFGGSGVGDRGFSELGWYASIGLGGSRIEAEGFGSDSNTEAFASAGVYWPLSRGDFYAGVEYYDGTAISLGYRYLLKP